jgi:hypothetical protein
MQSDFLSIFLVAFSLPLDHVCVYVCPCMCSMLLCVARERSCWHRAPRFELFKKRAYIASSIINIIIIIVETGVWISFSRHSPNWRVVRNFYSPNPKTTGQKYRVSERGKTPARLAGAFKFLLANPEFYTHLASWRVAICTPG